MGGIAFYNFFPIFWLVLVMFSLSFFLSCEIPGYNILLFVLIQERFYFGDNILPCFESGIPLLKRRLQDLPDSDNVRISCICISFICGSVLIDFF